MSILMDNVVYYRPLELLETSKGVLNERTSLFLPAGFY